MNFMLCINIAFSGHFLQGRPKESYKTENYWRENYILTSTWELQEIALLQRFTYNSLTHKAWKWVHSSLILICSLPWFSTGKILIKHLWFSPPNFIIKSVLTKNKKVVQAYFDFIVKQKTNPWYSYLSSQNVVLADIVFNSL